MSCDLYHALVYLADYVDPPYILSEPRDIIIKVAMVLFVMLPLSLLRNISKLEKVRGKEGLAAFTYVRTYMVPTYVYSEGLALTHI